MDPGKNKFFEKSLRKAAEYLKNRRRLAGLFASASAKLRNVKFSNINGKSFVNKIKVFVRMVKAYSNGSYRSIPWKNILLILAAIVYFVMPIDMIPDFIPVSGLLDDFTVIVWIYNTLRTEINEFLAWETKAITG